MNQAFKELPAGHELAFEKILSPGNNEVAQLIPYVVKFTTDLTGKDL